MVDDLGKRRPPDPSRIDINQEHEVRHWTKELGVSEAQLRAAVQVVGVMVVDVRKQLQKKK